MNILECSGSAELTKYQHYAMMNYSRALSGNHENKKPQNCDRTVRQTLLHSCVHYNLPGQLWRCVGVLNGRSRLCLRFERRRIYWKSKNSLRHGADIFSQHLPPVPDGREFLTELRTESGRSSWRASLSPPSSWTSWRTTPPRWWWWWWLEILFR